MSDDSDSSRITRRRALGGIATVGIASAALGAGGTAAYFSDSATSNNNTIETGDLNLNLGGGGSNTTISVSDVGPSDSGSDSINTQNTGTISGFVSLSFNTPDSNSDPELEEVLEITVKYGGNVVRKGTFGTVFDGEGEYSNADFLLGPGSNNKDLTVEWAVPTGAGNDVQNKTAQADITVNLNQQEEAFADVVVDSSGSGDASSIQSAVDAAPSEAVILVRDGTYDEEVTITDAGQTLASKNGSSNTKIRADAQSQNKAVIVDKVDNVTVDGFTITFNGNSSSNAEKFGLRARAGSKNATVRNCRFAGFTTEEVTEGTVDAVRSVGVTLTSEVGSGSVSTKTISRPIVENTTFENITCKGNTDQDGSNDSDSRAKGLAMVGDVQNAAVVRNEFSNIGEAANDPDGAQISTFNIKQADVDSGTRFTTSNVDNENAKGTDKPRGIDIIEGEASSGPQRFTILNNTFDGIVGVYGQPAIFVGGSGALPDHKVYNNTFHHPVDNLRGGELRLRDNDWNRPNNPDIPDLVPADEDKDGGVLIDRNGGNNYDTTYSWTA